MFADPRELAAAALNTVAADVSLVVTDWEELTRPLIVCRAVAGRRGTFDRVDDVRLEIIHPLTASCDSIAAARALTDNVVSVLAAPGVHDTAAGYIDRVQVIDINEPAPSPLFPGPYVVATVAARLWHRPQR